MESIYIVVISETLNNLVTPIFEEIPISSHSLLQISDLVASFFLVFKILIGKTLCQPSSRNCQRFSLVEGSDHHHRVVRVSAGKCSADRFSKSRK